MCRPRSAGEHGVRAAGRGLGHHNRRAGRIRHARTVRADARIEDRRGRARRERARESGSGIVAYSVDDAGRTVLFGVEAFHEQCARIGAPPETAVAVHLLGSGEFRQTGAHRGAVLFGHGERGQAGQRPLLRVLNRLQTDEQILRVDVPEESGWAHLTSIDEHTMPLLPVSVLETHHNDQWIDLIDHTPGSSVTGDTCPS